MLITYAKLGFVTVFSVENPVDNVNNFFDKKQFGLHNIFKIRLHFH